MFNTYIKVAIRNILKTKLYSFLNIVGLAIGLAGTILIILYTNHQLTYDSYHQSSDRIYRITSEFTMEGKVEKFAASSFNIAPLFKQEYPEVEEFARFNSAGQLIINQNENNIKIDYAYYTDQAALKIFKHEFINGNPINALTGINKAVLNESTAKKIFGSEDPVGKSLKLSNGKVFTVTGVFKDFPDNVHLKYDILLSMDTLVQLMIKKQGPESVDLNNTHALWQIDPFSYILLKPKVNEINFIDKIKGFGDKYANSYGKEFNASFEAKIQRLRDIHHCTLQWDLPQGKKEYIALFIIVGLFLLTIACINYMNMATARSAKRAKEVGLRKVVGAQKKQIILQFLIESVIITFIALFFAFIIVELVLPVFNQFAGTKLQIGLNTPWFLYLGIFFVTFIVGILSGSYPAFFLSSFQPAIVIKGEITKGNKGKLIREILVIFQFTLSIIMIIGTLIVIKQLNYLRNYPLGYNQENILVVNATRDSTYEQSYASFREELLKNPDISDVATSSNTPSGEQGKVVFSAENKGKITNNSMNFMVVDASYLKLLNLQFIEGTNFPTADGIHSTALNPDGSGEQYVINESARKLINWEDKALNHQISQSGIASNGKVIGVVKDFHYNSLHNPIEPLAFIVSNRPQNIISIKIKNTDTVKSIAFIEMLWNRHFQKVNFEYSFLDDVIDAQYESELKLSKIFSYFAIMCIFIACLGLLGLASYAAQQRTKEIGIRKVMGSSVKNIVFLLTKDFSKLVLISNIVAIPVSYYLMYKWLTAFPYHIAVPISSFIIAISSAFIISWITVGIIAHRAATSNPAETLRYE